MPYKNIGDDDLIVLGVQMTKYEVNPEDPEEVVEMPSFTFTSKSK
jgi:hypothetical protein